MNVLIVCSCFSSAHGQTRTVHITVVAPIDSFRGSQIYIAGNQSVFSAWNPGGTKLKKLNDSLWDITAQIAKGKFVEFKITRGTWESEAIFEQNQIPPNIAFTVVNDTAFVLAPLTWKDCTSMASAVKRSPPLDTVTGMVRYHRGLKGKNLLYSRDVVVWLPPSYEKNSRKRYPVLYMHDGQNIFNPATSFSGYDWRVDEVTDSLIAEKKIEEIIVVGIYNTPDRLPEYSDSKSGRAYAAFIVKKVKPLIDSHYRTKSDRKNTAVMGSSMGGLISFLCTRWYPEVFGKAGCLSSSFRYNNNNLSGQVRAVRGRKIRYYIDCGSREKELLTGTNEMIRLLRKHGYRKGKVLETYIEPGGTHNEQSWARRVWRPLVFIFGT